LIAALGAEPVDFRSRVSAAEAIWPSTSPDVPSALSGTIVESALKNGAQAIVTACPLCQYNLDVNTRCRSIISPNDCAALGLEQLSMTNFQ